jgi:hypothetical protein
MEYKGYEFRFNVRWLVRGVTHNAAVGVFKNGQMVAPCADIYLAQKYVDQRVKMDERLGRSAGNDKAGSKRDSKRAKDVRK